MCSKYTLNGYILRINPYRTPESYKKWLPILTCQSSYPRLNLWKIWLREQPQLQPQIVSQKMRSRNVYPKQKTFSFSLFLPSCYPKSSLLFSAGAQSSCSFFSFSSKLQREAASLWENWLIFGVSKMRKNKAPWNHPFQLTKQLPCFLALC